jgi:hypothetical protein
VGGIALTALAKPGRDVPLSAGMIDSAESSARGVFLIKSEHGNCVVGVDCIARGLIAGRLAQRADGGLLQIGVPSLNQHGVALAKSFSLEVNFGGRRRYLGRRPEEDVSSIICAMSLACARP